MLRRSAFVIGAIVSVKADDHECRNAADMEACIGMTLAGKECVWSMTHNGCGTREDYDAAIWGWSWEGVQPAFSKGTQTTYSQEEGHFTHYNNYEDHAWEEAVSFGEIRTFIRSDEKGRPTALGVSIPTDLDRVFPVDETTDPGGRFFFSKDHRCASAIPFTHFQVNYVTKGHPGGFPMDNLFKALPKGPDAINEVIGTSTWFQRHFDFHMHIDTPEESNSVTCSLGEFPPCLATEEEMARFENVPSPDYLPKSLVIDPIAYVPYMGAHWTPNAGNSFEEFAKEYAQVFGTYDGRVIFWEAMITASSFFELEVGEPKEWDYEVPEKVQVTGYYPTKLAMRKARVPGSLDNKEVYQVEFYGLEFRVGDDAYERMKGLKTRIPTEDDYCPPIDCLDVRTQRSESDKEKKSDFVKRMFCSSCGTHGVKAKGKRPKNVRPIKVHNSCECHEHCKNKGEGFKFQQRPKAARRGRKGRCTCLDKIEGLNSAFNPRYTSTAF